MIKSSEIWAPGSYAEAEEDASPLLSGVLSKAGIFGLITVAAAAAASGLEAGMLYTIIGWLGALTALFGALVPLVLDRVHIDPAMASGPFITITNDISALLIYFGVTILMISRMV